MSFTERWYNTMVDIYDWIVRNWIYLPAEEDFAKQYFAAFAPLPPLNEIIRNVSLVLVNSHRAISPPRPSMPSMFYTSKIIFIDFIKLLLFRCHSDRRSSY